MVTIRPFKGFRPISELAEKVASPPYDVLSSDEAREMAQGNPYSFLRVIKSEIDFDPNENPSREAIFQKGGDNLQKLIQEGSLKQDEKDCFYLYQQKMGDHTQTGLVAGSLIEDYNTGKIKKHEHTRPDKEDDRTKHVESLSAFTGPVFLTHMFEEDLDQLVTQYLSTKPDAHFTAPDGIVHTLWKVENDSHIQTIQTIFARIPFTYVADGHHRAAAASRVQKIRSQANSNHTGEEGYNYFLTVIFPDTQMKILDYNRVLKDLNGRTEQEILDLIQKDFDVQPLTVSDPEQAKPKQRTQFSMYLNNKWYLLTIRPDKIPNDPVDSLDVAILQNQVLTPIFNIQDPRTDKRIDFIGGIRGLKELEKRCKTDCKAAFALYPTGIDQLISVADSGKVMPPKSTWFEPKLRSGMVVKMLD